MGSLCFLQNMGRITRDSIELGSAELDMSIPGAGDSYLTKHMVSPKIKMLGFRVNILARGPFGVMFGVQKTYCYYEIVLSGRVGNFP